MLDTALLECGRDKYTLAEKVGEETNMTCYYLTMAQ